MGSYSRAVRAYFSHNCTEHYQNSCFCNSLELNRRDRETFIDNSSRTCWMGKKPGKNDPNWYVILHTRWNAFQIVWCQHQHCNALCRQNLEFARESMGYVCRDSQPKINYAENTRFHQWLPFQNSCANGVLLVLSDFSFLLSVRSSLTAKQRMFLFIVVYTLKVLGLSSLQSVWAQSKVKSIIKQMLENSLFRSIVITGKKLLFCND